MSIRAVYFDLGGVLLRTEDKSPRLELAKSLGLDYAGIEQVVFGKESVAATLGTISAEEHWRNIARSLGLPATEIPRLEEAFYAGDRLDHDLLGFLRALRPARKVGLISNAWSGLRGWIVDQKFEDVFDEMIISAEVGMGKPEAPIYHYALEKLGVHPAEAVFVDDMPVNIEAARALGMHGIVFQTAGQVIAELNALLAD